MVDGVSWLEIHEERKRQDAQWGGPEHDDEHGGLDWQTFIVEHAERGHLLHVAALGVAAADALSRLQESHASRIRAERAAQDARAEAEASAERLEAANKRLREGISGLAEITSGEIHEELEALLTDPSPAQIEAAD